MKNLTTCLLLLYLCSTPLAAQEIRGYDPLPDARRASQQITAAALRGHVEFLASDLLEGRYPGSRGDKLAQSYIAAQFATLGMTPLPGMNGFVQPFELIGIQTTAPATLSVQFQGRTLNFKNGDDVVLTSMLQQPQIEISNAELVFVGYGIQAPEHKWDDYKGVDVKDKILLMLNNDPSDDPKLFAGKRRLYYGRWTYKYEMAAKLGAKGAIIIHTDASAGYPWQVVRSSWMGEQCTLPQSKEPVAALQAWITQVQAKALVAMAGKDLDALTLAAQNRDFTPVALGIPLTLRLQNQIRRLQTANVVGMFKGSSPKRAQQYVVYGAHFDHLGMKSDAKAGEDAIYNGAVDNATGVAGLLSIAQAYAHLSRRPARSVVFAALAAEEQGLLGSRYFVENAPVPVASMAANINMDELPIWGRSKDITYIGKGKCTLDRLVEIIANMQGRVVKDDQFPEHGSFYRSDQFNFAKVGVPAAYFAFGHDIVGKPTGWGKQTIEAWENKDYHQVSDQLQDDWDLSGAIEDTQLNFYLGYEVAQALEMPRWYPGDEFEKARKRSLSDMP